MSGQPTLALVIGATGYVGMHLVRTGCALGGRVVAHVRPDSASGDARAEELASLGASVERTEWTESAMREMLGNVQPTVIYLLLGTTAARAKAAASVGGDASQQAVDLGLTMLLIDAAREVCPAAGLIYLSALGASPAGNEYLKVRAAIEARLRQGPNPFTVIRPSFITGDDRAESRPGERFGAMATDVLAGFLRAVGGRAVAASYRSISGQALARILWSLGDKPLSGQVHTLSTFRDR
jgi:uncharacterized protein YbjT (DUF2867 family)